MLEPLKYAKGLSIVRILRGGWRLCLCYRYLRTCSHLSEGFSSSSMKDGMSATSPVAKSEVAALFSGIIPRTLSMNSVPFFQDFCFVERS